MFRRKEESATDSAPNGSSSMTSSPIGGSSAGESPASSGSAPVASSSAAVSAGSSASAPVASHGSSAYAPATNTAPTPARPATPEPARSSAPATGSYRPTPIADFSRNVSRPSEPARPSASQSSFGSPAEKPAAAGAKASNRRVLTVGNDILLKGEIATCDRLVIEGRVEAKLSDVHTVEIAEAGSFKGTAEVEDAEISGVFEGDLIVRNRLVIYATGEVRGNIGYGEIEIERGGKLTGQIKTAGAGTASKIKPAAEADKTRKEATAA